MIATFYRDFRELTKARLAISVVFSSVCGYLLAVSPAYPFSWLTLVMLAIGGYCMVGASNAYNQIIERDIDAKMDRTKKRPIPSGRITPKQAFISASGLTLMGVVLLYMINPQAAMFGAISIFLYTSIYTPLKTVTPLSVFVGAFPGAIPFMLGWVAATNDFGIETGTLFLIQFFWQFPHFWAIGWFLFDDYQKAGIFMLPTRHKDKSTAIQIIMYIIWLTLASLLPALGITGGLYITPYSAVIVVLLGMWLLKEGVTLYKQRDAISARKLMITSVSYISVLQIVYVIDKFLR
ncbi:MAG: protoheme IX farnesyltransferase [Flavobacteriales bacterium]|nr:protoheme IX farnesyltransferase [Flavobacteriales bacterium]